MERIVMIFPIALSVILLLLHATVATNAGSSTKSMETPAASPTSQTHEVRSSSISAGSSNMIEKACATAKDKNSCIQSLKAEPGSANADLKTLAFMSLNITETLGVKISNWITQKLESQDLNPNIEQALTDCQEQYQDAVAQIEDSEAAFFANAYNDINTWVSTALSNAETCQDSLMEAGKEATTFMGNRNQVFAQHCSNTLAVFSVLAKQR